MTASSEYKKAEIKISDTLGKIFRRIGRGIAKFFSTLFTRGKQQFTVMFIPHSEKKIFNFRISVFSLIFLSILLTGVLIAFFLSATYFSGLSRMLTTKSKDLENTEASLEVVRDEIANLRKVSQVFETSMQKTLANLGIEKAEEAANLAKGGDLDSFLGIEEQQEGIFKELSELKSLSATLEESVDSLDKISKTLESHSELLVELPALWPLKGVRGRITNKFGYSEHPFTKLPYLHLGIDIAYRMGTPVVATATGHVVEKRHEPMGFGNYIIIRHKYGFSTKYAHLNQVLVEEGETVQQGQKIGTLGSTGLSTGPHLHYEVRIGSQQVDPERYMNIKNNLKEAALNY